MNFENNLLKRAENAENIIKEYMPVPGCYDGAIIEAMNYSVMAGGKRLRPVLIEVVYRLFGGKDDVVKPCMAAMEMLHSYTLVHDDLPAIDNDDYRRGRYTTHKEFGEAAAILAGDGLLHQAYETFIKAFDYGVSEQTVKALRIFGDCTGIKGMLGGQAADVLNCGMEIADDLMYYIYDLKTGALIKGSMMIGAALAGAADGEIEKIAKAGTLIGLAFQIKDDILDLTGDEAVIGKPVHSDEKNNKKTYVTVNGIDKSEEDIRKFSKEAKEIIGEIGSDDEERRFLTELIDYLVDRNK